MSDLERRVDQQEDFDERVANILYEKHKLRWRLLRIWILIFSLAITYNLHTNRNQTVENRHRIADNVSRIHDIQEFRLYSCKATYQSFLTVFRKILPKDHKNWNHQERAFWKNINTTVQNLQIVKCPKQTGVGKPTIR